MDILKEIPKPLAQSARRNIWICDTIWRIVDTRVYARQDTAWDQSFVQRLSRTINGSLKADQRQRLERAGRELEAPMASEPPLHKEAWHRAKGLYKAAANRALTPAQVTFERVMAEHVALYRQVPPR